MDYYKILGVNKTATTEEIVKAYRQKAIQFHPDKNPDNAQAAEEFKKCSEAYEILNDPVKRKKYDSIGMEPPRRSGPASNDFFTQFFREFERKGVNGNHVVVTTHVSLEEVYTGTIKKVPIKKRVICSQCHGVGGDETLCEQCEGRGVTLVTGAGIQISRPCHKCGGKGKMIISKCSACTNGYLGPKDEDITISVPAGIEDGMALSFRGHGEPGTDGGVAGNLNVVIKVIPHPVFERLKQGDVLIRVPVSYTQLVLGDEIEIPSLTKKRLVVKIPIRTESGRRLKLGKQGLPKQCYSNGLPVDDYGDLYVELKLELPETIDEEYVALVEKLVKFDTLSNHPKKKQFAEYLEQNEPTDPEAT